VISDKKKHIRVENTDYGPSFRPDPRFVRERNKYTLRTKDGVTWLVPHRIRRFIKDGALISVEGKASNPSGYKVTVFNGYLPSEVPKTTDLMFSTGRGFAQSQAIRLSQPIIRSMISARFTQWSLVRGIGYIAGTVGGVVAGMLFGATKTGYQNIIFDRVTPNNYKVQYLILGSPDD
jgi:hypothetical protein